MSSDTKFFSLNFATGFATFLSVLALIVCSVLSSLIYSEVQNVWNELDEEMLSFKVSSYVKDLKHHFYKLMFWQVTTDDLWQDMVKLSFGKRRIRQTSYDLFNQPGVESGAGPGAKPTPPGTSPFQTPSVPLVNPPGEQPHPPSGANPTGNPPAATAGPPGARPSPPGIVPQGSGAQKSTGAPPGISPSHPGSKPDGGKSDTCSKLLLSLFCLNIVKQTCFRM